MTPAAQPTARWHGLPIGHWLIEWDVPELLVFDSVPSTNYIARVRAEAGAPAGLIVLADHQSAGRGRLGRTWHDRPAGSILMSCLLRPAPAPLDVAPGTIPLRVGIAAATALRSATGSDVRLKWPNDLVVPGAGKVGGILCEAVNAGARSGYVVVGLGLNVHQRTEDWPPALRGVATSLAACATGPIPGAQALDRPRLMAALADALRPLRTAPLVSLTHQELDRFASLDALRDARVLVDSDPAPYDARGIDPDGALLTHRDGVVRRISSATVRLA